MAPISLIPVTLRSVKQMLEQLGYDLVVDDGRVLIWKKGDKPIIKGVDEAFANWPTVVSKQYPTFVAEGHDSLVYDRSDVTDLIVEITGTGRTNGVRLVALLRSEADDPDLPPAHMIGLTCAVCGKPSRIERWKPSFAGFHLKCTQCGHEEFRDAGRPDTPI